jgi:hypothetical protein
VRVLLSLTWHVAALARRKSSNRVESRFFLLAAVNNHLNAALVCQVACWALYHIACGSKENTKRLISLGGATAAAKIREKWSENDAVQTKVRSLAKLIGTEMNSWVDEE